MSMKRNDIRIQDDIHLKLIFEWEQHGIEEAHENENVECRKIVSCCA